MSAPSVHRPINYLIPEGYVGWVTVDYGVVGAPALPLQNDHLLVKFPNSRVVQTQSKLEYGWASDKYFYYTMTGQQRELKNTKWGGGGMIWAGTVGSESDGKGGMRNIEQRFFVGTEEQYKHGPGGANQDGKP
jgi:hypothetical protein